ncbi:hypothetical protein MTQ01_11340 [Streptomyces sp. XM4193]|uniref:hypothetical protein n=1 Tax=Streptomyces sp. XM4193 TaxID=2929782 RepID=UPI001FFB0E2F|nr:hypothetical protein [Streptomyces sp. XM4193]MCK1796595.1 hypothetical protein [Streptomyces sp. XM4193]
MNTGTKIGAFAGALALTFGAAWGVGAAAGPFSADRPKAPHGSGHDAGREDRDGHGGERGAEHGDRAHPETAPGGLEISKQGYTLDLHTPRITADGSKKSELRFRIRDRDGDPLTSYAVEHGRELHLILVDRDLDTFCHLHPTRAADGTWSTDVSLPRAGAHRLFADFKPDREGAEALTLGADLAVAGAYEPAELPEPSDVFELKDGYRVELDGRLTPGRPERLTLRVGKDGERVTDLQPHLGAYGHLVALRAGDLAYLHVHPEDDSGDGGAEAGPAISFSATAPSAGDYRLFLDFRHEGTVRTAEFTVSAGPGRDGEEDHDRSPKDRHHDH